MEFPDTYPPLHPQPRLNQFNLKGGQKIESRDSDTCTPVFIVVLLVLFAFAKKWKQPK